MAMYNERMQPEIKARWLARLRDPNEKQTTRYLEKRDTVGNIIGRCCLGVLSDEVKDEVPGLNVSIDRMNNVNYNFNNSTLCHRVQDYCDLDERGSFRIYNTDGVSVRLCHLAELNDDDFTFNQIADVVNYFF